MIEWIDFHSAIIEPALREIAGERGVLNSDSIGLKSSRTPSNSGSSDHDSEICHAIASPYRLSLRRDRDEPRESESRKVRGTDPVTVAAFASANWAIRVAMAGKVATIADMTAVTAGVPMAMATIAHGTESSVGRTQLMAHVTKGFRGVWVRIASVRG
jgi:hypothetical protein